MKQIKLTQNQYALVDDEDFEKVSQFKWYFTSRGYAATKSSKGTFLMHRFILNIFEKEVIDHKNFNQLDNRKNNLRICTQQQNTFHSRMSKNNTSGIKGVTWNKQKNKWRAQLGLNRKNINLGLYSNLQGAFLARRLGERLYYAT